MMGRGKAGAYRAFVTCTVDDIVLQCRWEWPNLPCNCLQLPVQIH